MYVNQGNFTVQYGEKGGAIQFSPLRHTCAVQKTDRNKTN